MPTLFPSILPDGDFIDDSYSEGEIQDKEYSELQSIAAEHPSDDVHGQMSKDTLKEELVGLERLSE